MPSAALIATDWSPRRQPLATADPRAGVLRRLQVLLARDERTRPRPPITLPLAARANESPCPSPPAPAPAPESATPTVAEIVAAVASHFGVPVTTLVRKRERTNAPRRPAEEIVIYLARSLRRQTLAATAAELGISDAKAWNVCSKIRHRRVVDPRLDQTLTAIEAQLGAAAAR